MSLNLNLAALRYGQGNPFPADAIHIKPMVPCDNQPTNILLSALPHQSLESGPLHDMVTSELLVQAGMSRSYEVIADCVSDHRKILIRLFETWLAQYIVSVAP